MNIEDSKLEDSQQINTNFKGDEKISLVNPKRISETDTRRNHFIGKVSKPRTLQSSANRSNNNRYDEDIKSNDNNIRMDKEFNKYNNLDKDEDHLNPHYSDTRNNKSNTDFNKQSHMSFTNKNKFYDSNIPKESYQELLEENNVLKQRLLEESHINRKNNENINKIMEEYSKLNMKCNAVLIHASSLQKKIDELELEKQDVVSELSKLKSSDWGKLLLEKESIIRSFEKELIYYKQEINCLKNFNNNNNNNEFTKRVDTLLENYLEENKKLNKSLEEYKQKDTHCTRKWNDLINENNNNKEKIGLLLSQLSEQKEEYNKIIEQYDCKIIEILDKFPKMLNDRDPKKASAAGYLVEQVNFFMEEKRKENVVKLKLQEEVGILQNEKDDLVKHIQTLENFISKLNSGETGIRKLKGRIEELEDLVIQQNNTSSPNRFVVYEDALVNLDLEKKTILDKLEVVSHKLKQYIENKDVAIFDEKSVIISLTKALREKDLQIISLKNQAKQLAGNNSIDNIRNPQVFNDSRNDNRDEDYFERSTHNFNPSYFVSNIEYK